MSESQLPLSDDPPAVMARGDSLISTIWKRAQRAIGRRVFVAVLLVVAALFPIVSGNEGDIDAAANALAFAILALGLNIVVGFAGLLDLATPPSLPSAPTPTASSPRTRFSRNGGTSGNRSDGSASLNICIRRAALELSTSRCRFG